MPALVMIAIARAITRPSVQANRFGLADTHCGSWRAAEGAREPSERAQAQAADKAQRELGEEQHGHGLDRRVDLREVREGEGRGSQPHRQAGDRAHRVLVEHCRAQRPAVDVEALDRLAEGPTDDRCSGSRPQAATSVGGSNTDRVACKAAARRSCSVSRPSSAIAAIPAAAICGASERTTPASIAAPRGSSGTM